MKPYLDIVNMQKVENAARHLRVQADLQGRWTKYAQPISDSFSILSNWTNQWMRLQGFWESRNTPEKLALIHSEVSEALEAHRAGDDENLAEELADTVIRILDFCGEHEIDLGGAIVRKALANLERPRKHNKVC